MKRQRTKKQMERDEKRILTLMKHERGNTSAYFVTRTNMTEHQFGWHARKLKSAGKVFKIGLRWYHIDDLPDGTTITVEASEDPIVGAIRSIEERIQELESKSRDIEEELIALNESAKVLEHLLE